MQNPRPLLDKIKIGNSRVLLVDPRQIKHEKFNHAIQDVALFLFEQTLSLICPPDRKEAAGPVIKSLDVFAMTRKEWRGYFDVNSRKLYK